MYYSVVLIRSVLIKKRRYSSCIQFLRMSYNTEYEAIFFWIHCMTEEFFIFQYDFYIVPKNSFCVDKIFITSFRIWFRRRFCAFIIFSSVLLFTLLRVYEGIVGVLKLKLLFHTCGYLRTKCNCNIFRDIIFHFLYKYIFYEILSNLYRA